MCNANSYSFDFLSSSFYQRQIAELYIRQRKSGKDCFSPRQHKFEIYVCLFSFALWHAFYWASFLLPFGMVPSYPLTQHLVNLASQSLLLESCSWQNASWQETKQQQQQQPQQCITIMPFLLKGNREDFWIIHYSR